MIHRYLLALAATLCGCVQQQTVSSQPPARAKFPAEQRLLAENFLKALYRPELTPFSVVIAPEVNAFDYASSPQLLQVQLRERLHDFRASRGDFILVLRSDSKKHLYGRFVRSSGRIEYFASEKQADWFDLILDTSPESIDAIYTNYESSLKHAAYAEHIEYLNRRQCSPQHAFTSNIFHIRPGEQTFRFVTWRSPEVY